MNFEFIFLGQSILRYEVPLDIFHSINNIYDKKFKENILPSANSTLIGKIQNENSMYYNGEDESRVKRHNELPLNVINWFTETFRHYLDFNKIRDYKLSLNSVWVNEMKANEYNPMHIHQGTLLTGLSSVMILKLPDTYGVEYSAAETPQNGRLQLLGSSSGQFAKVDYQPPMALRDFYIFPYDMRHTVYPFNGTTDTRRTLAANCDVLYNSVINRGA
jgi:hypothetical protein